MSFSVIKNGEELATTPLRRDALVILEAGYRAVLTKEIVGKQVEINGQQLKIDGQIFSLNAYQRIFFVGIGKCALDAGQVIEEKLHGWLTDGIILDVRGAPLRKLRSSIGTHPFPSEENIEVTKSIAEMLEGLTEHDLLITVISGGGSSLLCLPYDLSCEALSSMTKALMDKGATIAEINTVRKHTSQIQGGQFAKLAYPATIVSMIFSDVPGNDMGMIASGPTVLDRTTADDARAVLAKYDILNICKLPECNFVDTPKEEHYFERVHNILFATNTQALEMMKREAEKLGYGARVEDAELQGEAREVGARLMREAVTPKTCRLFGGETTVTVKKDGKGGRCQEVVLGGLEVVRDGVVIVAAASDGWDNTPFAGALGDVNVVGHARELGIDPKLALADNKAYDFFEKVGTHLDTGRTGANVSDWYFTLTA
ncbi:MAG: DUF4147 domain-containing protein [Patescibacteria group bacterium]